MNEPFYEGAGVKVVEENLHCPRCDSEYLHQGAITSYYRAEDAKDLTVAYVSGSLVTMNIRSDREAHWHNPSGRRDGITIAFDCEGCGNGLTLTLAQHKGQTYIKWLMSPATNVEADVS